MNKSEYIGKKFGRWEVISVALSKGYFAMCWCRCECGTERSVRFACLKSGESLSCGCYARDQSSKRAIHGHAANRKMPPEYKAWVSMRERCRNPNNKMYHNYGGRGIKVCDRWLTSFQNFYEDMGKRPSLKHSIDRINNDGNYEPSNCRWVTHYTQDRNRRTNRWLEYRGKRMVLIDWAIELGRTRGSFDSQLRQGKPMELIVAQYNAQTNLRYYNGINIQ